MRAIAALLEEHRAIALVLDCLERFAKMTEVIKKIDPDCAHILFPFFNELVVDCHFKKEDSVLLPVLEKKPGFASRRASFALIYLQHNQYQAYLAAMQDFLKEYQDPQYAARFVGLAGRFGNALRMHLRDEDERLHPFVDSLLTEEDQPMLLQGFETLERGKLSKGAAQNFVQTARTLVAQFGVWRAQAERKISTSQG